MITEAPQRRRSPLPEGIDPRDKGCGLHPSCLSCPRPKCRYDETPSELAARRSAVEEAFRLRAHGLTAREIAERVNRNPRTVFRMLAKRASPC